VPSCFVCVPKEILYDNAKSVVIKRDGYGEGQHRWNDDFLDLAKLYGFMPRLCRPYRARTEGKVERFHRYLRGNFYAPASPRRNDNHLDAQFPHIRANFNSLLEGGAVLRD
jgi:transposase